MDIEREALEHYRQWWHWFASLRMATDNERDLAAMKLAAIDVALNRMELGSEALARPESRRGGTVIDNGPDGGRR